MKRSFVITMIAGAVCCTVLVPAAVGSSSGSKNNPKQVKVSDNYFSTSRVTIKKHQYVKFVWSSSNFSRHNVTLVSGPRGVKTRDFKSKTGSTGIRFKRKFSKAGSYHFECTIHSYVMKMTVVVKR
jgi:plastocyanin